MLTIINGLAKSIGKVLPVGLTARLAFFGVIALAISGGTYTQGHEVDTVREKAGVELIAHEVAQLRIDLQDQRKDVTARLDRIEDSVNELLRERRAASRGSR